MTRSRPHAASQRGRQIRRWSWHKTKWKLEDGCERRGRFRQKGGWQGASFRPIRNSPDRGRWGERRERLPRSRPMFFRLRLEEREIGIAEEYFPTPEGLARRGKHESHPV